MLARCQRNQSVVCRTSRDTSPGELAMCGSRGTRTELQRHGEVPIDQRHSIGSSYASVAGQPGEDRVRLRQGVPTKTQCSTLGPRSDHRVVSVRRHHQRHGDAGVDRRHGHRCQRRPESISANIISSLTSVSARATKRPLASRSTRAVLPPGVICNPPPYAETSTVDPGVSPSASRSCLGKTIRPPESMTASMGLGYQRDPIRRVGRSDHAPTLVAPEHHRVTAGVSRVRPLRPHVQAQLGDRQSRRQAGRSHTRRWKASSPSPTRLSSVLPKPASRMTGSNSSTGRSRNP